MRPDSVPPEALESIESGDNVLVQAPSDDVVERIYESIKRRIPSDVFDLFVIAYLKNPREILTCTQRYADTGLPDRIGIVAIDPSVTDPADELATESIPAERIYITYVTSPGNLTNVGTESTQIIRDWKPAQHQTLGYFDSLTALLNYTTDQQAFKFLQTLTLHLASSEAITLYYMDPRAHRDRTVHRLAQLFDMIIEVSGAGAAEWNVRHR